MQCCSTMLQFDAAIHCSDAVLECDAEVQCFNAMLQCKAAMHGCTAMLQCNAPPGDNKASVGATSILQPELTNIWLGSLLLAIGVVCLFSL